MQCVRQLPPDRHAGQSVDVIEIDGASNRGIDEIRDVREKVKFAPGPGPYKMYIIDEVHMLTVEAFNALLKVLEEPPGTCLRLRHDGTPSNPRDDRLPMSKVRLSSLLRPER